MIKAKSKAPRPTLTIKHKIGYGLGDAGGCMTFAIMGSTFAMYCTDALKIDTELLTLLLVIWNVWDFVNDPLMGSFMTSTPEKKYDFWKEVMKNTGAATLEEFRLVPP